MTNPFKGELEVSLGNQKYKTKLTIDACIRIESALNTSLVKLATKLTEGDLTISDIANIVTPAIRGGGNNLSHSEVTKIIFENGMVEGLRVCGEILTNVLTGGAVTPDGDQNEKKFQEDKEEKMI